MMRNRTKNLLLVLCLLLIPIGMSAQGKKITLKLSNAQLPAALRQVEQQSGYYKMIYARDEVKGYKVTADINGQDAVTAVRSILKDLPLKAEVDGRYIHISRDQKAQPSSNKKAVRGMLLDADGEPLIGATVMVDGTNIGTVTDIDGNYVLEGVDEDAMLTYSYIGKRAIRRKAGAKRAVIILEDQNAILDDVMVTGYQQLSRERATGAFDRVNQEMLEARPGADISSALQGLVAGMQGVEKEDGTVDFMIRGTSSLYADTQPLVVVDGFPIEGTFSSINPNDVESVTVLKDAAAASIWGARSANGVIVVTTKKAKQGKVRVDAQAFWRLGTTPDLDYNFNQLDSRQTVDYEMYGLTHGLDGDWMPGGIYGVLGKLTEVQELYYGNQYGGLSDAEMNAGLEKLRNRSNRDQLKKYMMQQQLLQQYNVSLSGGTERFNSYLSMMYEHNDEATIKRGYERFMANFNAEYRFNKHIKATAAMTWQKRRDDKSGYTLSELGNQFYPYEMVKNDDGSYAYNAGGWNRLGLDGVDISGLPYPDMSFNPLREVENRSYKTDSDLLRTQLGLNFNLFDGLSYDIKYQYETTRTDNRQIDGEETYATRYDVNFYTTFNQSTGVVSQMFLPMGARLKQSNRKNHNQVFRNQLSYNKVFGGIHDVSALAGIEMSEYVMNSTNQPTLYGYDSKSNTAPAVWYGSKDNINNLYNSSYSSTSLIRSLGYTFYKRTDRYLSYFGNAAYMYNDKYGASFSIRSDGSNFVSEDKSLRWSPMWSVGAKWNISKENFMKDVNWVNWLTLRATYGLNGNAEKSTSPQTLISMSADAVTYTNTARVASYGNPSLRWETTKTLNLGADFALFKNVLSGKIDWYSRKSVDVIGEVAIPSFYGSTSQMFNNAEITNRGIELELNGKFQIKSIGLGINSTLTYAYNKNKVTKLYNPNITNYYLTDGTFVEGYPVGAFFAYQYGGMDLEKDGQGNITVATPYIVNADGTKADMFGYTAFDSDPGWVTYQGTTVAPHTLGWANEFSWKGLSLYVFLTGKFGHKFRTPVPSYYTSVSSGRQFLNKYLTVFTESDGSEHPTPPANYDWMSFYWQFYHMYLDCWVQDASFIRLKELSLSYQLPQKWMRALHISQAKIFCQARDLGLLWKANSEGLDPEWLPDNFGGVNKPATTITLGVNLKF